MSSNIQDNLHLPSFLSSHRLSSSIIASTSTHFDFLSILH